jgi:hypothetical protein
MGQWDSAHDRSLPRGWPGGSQTGIRDAIFEFFQVRDYLIKRRSLPKEHLAYVPICAAVSSSPLCAVVTLRL